MRNPERITGAFVAIVLFMMSGVVSARFRSAATQPAAGAANTAPATQPADAVAETLPWFTTFSDALNASRRTRLPILVDVGAEWCVWCRELDQQIATETVQQKLRGFVRLRLDADRDVDSIRNLAVGPLPALRMLAPNGQVAAWHNGFMKADELAAWLEAHAHQAAAAPSAELETAGPPDAAAMDRIVAQLTDRDPVLHEAAARRLLPYADQAAPKIVSVFATGKLGQRLAARELLAAWKAPVEGLDPWKPESINLISLDVLRQWAAKKHDLPAAAPALSGDDLGIARHDIAAMLQTSDAAEVESVRERLARFGSSLLPEVYAALKAANTDRDRERLIALRYRAVAPDSRALHWPGGFERLASTDAQVRHQALEELGKDASAADAPLLMELFSDPDPLMRETSLRLLQSVGGGGIPGGLVRLLHDPEPNVRAAVLKQLAETPDPQMVGEVVKYVATEKDTDLIVHSIRFLREVKVKASMTCLQSLLANENWRVRAEAAEGLGKFIERSSSSSQEMQADIFAAMIKLLDDPDGFVVSRALAVLKEAQVPSAVKAIAKIADKRPELAPDVVKALGSQSNDQAAQAALRRFCSHKDAAVRSAAMTALGTNATADELGPALKDPEGRVRIAAATVVEELLEQSRPDYSRNSNQAETIDWEQWLQNFRAGKGQPDWAKGMLEPLRTMLKSDDAHERLVAALPLVALSGEKPAIEALRQLLASQSAQKRQVASALQWLRWEERIELFDRIRAAADDDAQLLTILANDLVTSPDDKAVAPLWELLNAKGANISVASQVHRSLIRAYTGADYWNFREDTANAEQKKKIVEASKKMADGGSANQRLVGLVLLLTASPDDAAASAMALLEKGGAGDGLETAALQILLLSQPRPVAEKTAIARLSSSPALKKIALAYLAAGGEAIRTIQGEMYLNSTNLVTVFHSGEDPIVINPPAGATMQIIEPLLKDSDPENVAYAGYLACLLGERKGLDPLVNWWQAHRDDDTLRHLAFQAIAALNDDSLTPVLEQIYATYDKSNGYELRDFYWTIRTMKGPQILKLRKRIREEVGMQQLR